VTKLNSTAACVLGFLDVGPPPPDRARWVADGTMSGAEVWTGLERSVGGFWSMTRSQVYQELRRLADAELAVVDAAGRYAVSESGRQAAREWFHDFALGEPRDEQVRSPVALTVFFGNYLEPELLERLVREYQLRFERRLQVLRGIEGALEDDRSLPGTTLRRGMFHLEGAVAWTQDVLDRLANKGRPARRVRSGRRASAR
jgi:DNA-binding PadR family transcriptional regulator